MTLLELFRYVLAVVGIMTLPTVLIFWLMIHPFIGFWRKVGPSKTYAITLSVMFAGAAAMFYFRVPLLEIEYGFHWPLMLAGALCVTGAAMFRFILHQHFSLAQLVGLPELSPQKHGGPLVTDGLHGRIRHPRYVQLLLSFFGYALMANYLAVYISAAFWVPGLYIIILLEERELRERYGQAYEDYCQRVPRFIPKRK